MSILDSHGNKIYHYNSYLSPLHSSTFLYYLYFLIFLKLLLSNKHVHVNNIPGNVIPGNKFSYLGTNAQLDLAKATDCL